LYYFIAHKWWEGEMGRGGEKIKLEIGFHIHMPFLKIKIKYVLY
jgi:hypothetical protein